MRAARIPRLVTALAVLLPTAPLPAAAPPGPIRLPDGGLVRRVDFERHLMGLVGRMGCNAGSCHGSFQGKGGFRLSLFGHDPQKDYLALTRDGFGRRVNPVDPEQSLVLLKPTGQVKHGGGLRFAKGSWQYQLLLRWITDGARWEKGSGEVAGLRIQIDKETRRQGDKETGKTGDSACVLNMKAGQVERLRVWARFTDGSTEDITPFCDFRINDDAVADVSRQGEVKALRAGDTAVVVSYRGHVVPVRVLVPQTLPRGFRYPKVPEKNYIDHEVFAKLRRLNLVPSPPAGDAEFLRRVTIDTIGTLPTPSEVRAFLADKSPDKRARKIDELLSHPLHAALWATKFCDITGNNTDSLEQPPQLKARRSQMWHDWFRKRLAANVAYDEIVRGVLCATSRDGREPEEWVRQFKQWEQEAIDGFATSYAAKPSLDLFWRRQQNVPPDQWGQKTAAAFLGVRIECAECHKHPYDRWTQADYRAFGNVFAKVAFGVAPESRRAVNAENLERRKNLKAKKPVKGKKFVPRVPLREVFVLPRGKGRQLPDPDNPKKPLGARALGGPEIPLEDGTDPRVELFAWMRAPDNPFFARSFVNRVWGHYLGVGIVDPVDDFSLANPPSNERLLDALAKDFVGHGYDIRHLERAVLNSRVYQLSSAASATNRLDRTNYSHALVRPMMAEVVVDVLDAALGVGEKWGADAPPGTRAIEVGASRVGNGAVAYAFRVFGRPPRTTACDCERAQEPALPQKLYLMTDPALLGKIQGGRLQALLGGKKGGAGKTDEQVLEELFLATLSRYPTEADKKCFADYREARRKASPRGKLDRRALFADTLWALINTREFILNH